MRSYRGEIIMFTADANMAGWGFHWVNQLRKGGYEHWVMLADRRVRGIARRGAMRGEPIPPPLAQGEDVRVDTRSMEPNGD